MSANGPGELIGPSFTDVAGEPATEAQRLRQYQRYLWAAGYCRGKRVVEVACGTGQGLSALGALAQSIAGADYSPDNLAMARATYGPRMPLLRLDAHALPLRDASMDVVLLLETLYFLPAPAAFVAEAARALRPGGRLLVSVINKDCWDFNPSPLYPEFFGAANLSALLRAHGLSPALFGGFPLDRPGLRQRLFRPIKKAAVALHLIPRTVQGRRWLKRIVFGPMVRLPREIRAGDAPYASPVPIEPDRPDGIHQVILAAAEKPA